MYSSIFLGTRLVTKKPRKGISFLHEFIREGFVFLKTLKAVSLHRISHCSAKVAMLKLSILETAKFYVKYCAE